MTDLSCDVAILGAGTAGLAAERSARKAGARTLLIDPYFAGTVCATVGCMPSKLLIAAGNAAHGVRQAPEFGVMTQPPQIDGAAVMARVRALRDDFAASTKEGFESLPEGTCVQSRARFTAPGELVLEDGRRVSARAVVLATGSAPVEPGPFKDLGDRVLTNQTVFDLPDLPKRLAVIGAGPIGLELAQAMARLGVEVTLFDHADRLGGLADDAVHEALLTTLRREMVLHLGTKATPEDAGEAVRLSWEGGSAEFDRVLLAAGRPPNVRDLGLEAAGLTLDDHGVPVFDRETLQCGEAPVFIAGDANADRPVLHEASAEGAIAGRNAVAWPAVVRSARMVPFSMIFTDPPVVQVGRAPQGEALTGRSDYGDQGRARVEARGHGQVLLQAAAPDGRLTGAEICAPGGEHLGHLLAWAITEGHTASDLLSRPFYHPTLEEGLRNALRDICRATSRPLPGDQDEGAPPGG